MARRRWGRLWLKHLWFQGYFYCSLQFRFQRNFLSKTLLISTDLRLVLTRSATIILLHFLALKIKNLAFARTQFIPQLIGWFDHLANLLNRFPELSTWGNKCLKFNCSTWVQVEKRKHRSIGVIKGNCSFLFIAVSAILTAIVENAIQRPVWEKL